MELKDSASVALAFSAMLAILAYFTGGILFYVVFAVMALFVAADYLWLRLGSGPLKRGISVSARVPEKELALGISEPYALTAIHRGRTRLGLSMLAMLDDSISIVSSPPDKKMKLQPGGESTLNMVITPTRCGKFDVGHARVVVSSLFFRDSFPSGNDNLISVRLSLGASGLRPRIVYSASNKASTIFRNVVEKHGGIDFAGGMMGADIVVEKRGGTDFAGVREYAAGDNIKHIDWALSARTGELCVREYETERTLPMYLLLDMSYLPAEDGRKSVDFSIGIATASIKGQLVECDKLGLICFSKKGILYHVKPGMGREHVSSLIGVLSKLQPMGDEASSDGCGPGVTIRELYDIKDAFGPDAGMGTLTPIIEETTREYIMNTHGDGFIQAILTAVLTMKNPCQIKIVTGLSMGVPSFTNGVRLAKYYGHSVTTIINASAYQDKERSADLGRTIRKLRSQSLNVLTPDQNEAPEISCRRLTSRRRSI